MRPASSRRRRAASGLESGINCLYSPGVINFDMSLQKEFAIAKEGRARLQFRVDAFNVFNHANFTGLNTHAELQRVPTTNGVVTGLPTITCYGAGTQCQRQLQRDWLRHCDTAGPGALGYSRILQTLVRIQF